MWIYNGEMLINLENGVNLHLRKTDPRYGDYEGAVALSVPVETEGDNSNWVFQGTEAECANYIEILSKDLNAQKMPAYGTKTAPEPKPEREPRYVPADYSDIPF